MADDRIPLTNIPLQYQPFLPALQAAVHSTATDNSVITRFENTFADLMGVDNALACAGPEAALQLAVEAAGIQPGDEIITSPFNRLTHALPHISWVFADVCADTLNLDAHDVERHLTKKTKAIMPVHTFGYPADMEALMHLANEHGLQVFENCVQAPLAQADGVRVGSIGDMGIFGFTPAVALGQNTPAGCLITNDGALAQKARQILAQNAAFQMPATQAALLQALVPQAVENWIENRQKAAAWYEEELAGVPVQRPPVPPAEVNPTYTAYALHAERAEELVAFLAKHHIEAALAFAGFSIPDSLPCARHAQKETLLLPMFPDITPEQVERVCGAVRDFYEEDATL